MPFERDRLVVAVAQLACDDDPAALLAAHLDTIAVARGDDVDLLLFPELSLTGYAAGCRGALPDTDTLSRLSAACGKMAISVGLPEEGATGLLYNTQLLLHDGAVLHRHRKINVPTYGKLDEGRYFAAGRAVASVRLGRWRIATLICADTWNPALPWVAALGGADILLVPVASAADAVGAAFDQDAGWTVNARHTALTYGLPVLLANHVGEGFWGGSRILDANGADIERLHGETGLGRAELHLDAIRSARRRLPTTRDSSPDLVLHLLQRALADRE